MNAGWNFDAARVIGIASLLQLRVILCEGESLGGLCCCDHFHFRCRCRYHYCSHYHYLVRGLIPNWDQELQTNFPLGRCRPECWRASTSGQLLPDMFPFSKQAQLEPDQVAESLAGHSIAQLLCLFGSRYSRIHQ